MEWNRLAEAGSLHRIMDRHSISSAIRKADNLVTFDFNRPSIQGEPKKCSNTKITTSQKCANIFVPNFALEDNCAKVCCFVLYLLSIYGILTETQTSGTNFATAQKADVIKVSLIERPVPPSLRRQCDHSNVDIRAEFSFIFLGRQRTNSLLPLLSLPPHRCKKTFFYVFSYIFLFFYMILYDLILHGALATIVLCKSAPLNIDFDAAPSLRQILTKCSKIKHVYEVLCAKQTRTIWCNTISEEIIKWLTVCTVKRHNKSLIQIEQINVSIILVGPILFLIVILLSSIIPSTFFLGNQRSLPILRTM